MHSPAEVELGPSRLVPEEQGSGIRLFGWVCLLLFLFITFSRITDILLPSLHLALIASLFSLTATVLSGGLKRAFDSRPGFWLSALTIWLIVCVPFSSWPGGSTYLLRDQWSKSFLAFVITAGLPVTLRECRWTMYSIGIASVAVVLMCLAWGTTSAEGRLVAEASGGALANPNDLAQLLLVGLPFLMLLTMSRTKVVVKRTAGAIVIVGVLFVTVQTGSRMASLALACLFIAIMANSSWRTRIKAVLAVAVVAGVVFPAMSPEQRLRYLTTFEQSSQEDLSRSELAAIGTKEARIEEFQRSVRYTLQRPLFGVGPGTFSTYAAREIEQHGERAPWVETHNTYTQMSSEAGIPAMLFYLGALVASLRMTRSTFKKYRDNEQFVELANASYCMWLCLVTFAATATFSNMAYQTFLPILAGISVALDKCVQTSTVVAIQPAVTSATALWGMRVSPRGRV